MRRAERRGVGKDLALLRNRRGVAMVEFALLLPVMLLLYLGGVQLQDAMSCKRKVTTTTRAAVDLIAQNTSGTTTKAEVQANLDAAAQVMLPYDGSAAQIRVTQISTDKYGYTWIIWSQGKNTAGYPRGARASVPAAMGGRGTTFLIAQISYPYQPVTTFGSVGAMTLSDTLWMVPRNTDQITCSDC